MYAQMGSRNIYNARGLRAIAWIFNYSECAANLPNAVRSARHTIGRVYSGPTYNAQHCLTLP